MEREKARIYIIARSRIQLPAPRQTGAGVYSDRLVQSPDENPQVLLDPANRCATTQRRIGAPPLAHLRWPRFV